MDEKDFKEFLEKTVPAIQEFDADCRAGLVTVSSHGFGVQDDKLVLINKSKNTVAYPDIDWHQFIEFQHAVASIKLPPFEKTEYEIKMEKMKNFELKLARLTEKVDKL